MQPVFYHFREQSCLDEAGVLKCNGQMVDAIRRE